MTEMNEVKAALKQKLKELQRDYERLDYEARVILDDIERLKDEYADGEDDMRRLDREMDDVERQLSEYGE